MSKVLAAQAKRCLGCGAVYEKEADVVFQTDCMHHHCVGCCAVVGCDSTSACAVCVGMGDAA
jgi:hypothetical protein